MFLLKDKLLDDVIKVSDNTFILLYDFLGLFVLFL